MLSLVEPFSLPFCFLPLSCPRQTFRGKWSFRSERLNFRRTRWKELRNLASSFRHHRFLRHRLSVCPSNYFSNFFPSSFAVLSFFFFFLQLGRMAPLWGVFSLWTIGNRGKVGFWVKLYRFIQRMYIPLGRFKDLGGFSFPRMVALTYSKHWRVCR